MTNASSVCGNSIWRGRSSLSGMAAWSITRSSISAAATSCRLPGIIWLRRKACFARNEKGAEVALRALSLSCRRCSGLLRQSPASLRDDRAESVAFVHRDIGQDLPVEIDARELQAVHELTIGQAFLADSGVDALDPEGAEAPL